jgi:GNAT superfamily N-acetyltransferase
MEVRLATQEDAPLLAEMLDEATAYVATLGFEQWPVPFPHEELLEGIERGEVYVVVIDGEPAATFTVLWNDPFYWGEQPPDSAYLHKLAVRRAFAGRGIGTQIVDWVDREAASAGRQFVRLDCIRDNPGIRAYYERLGFEHRGDLDLPRVPVALFERAVGPR